MLRFGLKTLGIRAAINRIRGLNRFQTNAAYRVGTNVEYAGFVEFGTSRMAAQPYLRPAAQTVGSSPGAYISSAETGDAIIREIALAVEAEAKRNAPVRTGNLHGSIRTWPE